MSRQQGRIVRWNDAKGYGFIQPAAGGEQLFVHISAFDSRQPRPQTGQSVSYQASTDKRGRPCALNAALAGSKASSAALRMPSGKTVSHGVALTFLSIVAIAASAGKLPVMVALAYGALSLATYFIYALDKSAAKRGARRTPENTLHLLALAGGWPGALIAQQTLRHKSSKQSFQIVFWLTVLLNIAAFIWLFSAAGKLFLSSQGLR